MEESWVRLPVSNVYGMGFWRVGNVLVVLGCSVGVVAIFVIVLPEFQEA
jgi:hypothetical protein